MHKQHFEVGEKLTENYTIVAINNGGTSFDLLCTCGEITTKDRKATFNATYTNTKFCSKCANRRKRNPKKRSPMTNYAAPTPKDPKMNPVGLLWLTGNLR